MEYKIVNVIKDRLKVIGMSQAQFAQCISATPSQTGIFLNHKGSLSNECLDKSLEVVGINLSMYSNRINLAKRVANILISKNVNSIENWTKEELAMFTHEESIRVLIDVKSKEEYTKMEQSGLIDIESTFVYFKTLVSYFICLGSNNTTAKQSARAMDSLFKSSKSGVSSVAAAGVAAVGVAAVGGAAVGVSLSIFEMAVVAPLLTSAFAKFADNSQTGAYTLFTKTSSKSLFVKALEYIHGE